MSSEAPAIRVLGLSKRYTLGTRVAYKTLRDGLARAARSVLSGGPKTDRPQNDTFWALKDVSFDVSPGQVVGLIGRNGAGKSTLLKILSRITEPTAGSAEVRGRVGSLLEVGTGFHPELTGRENIFLNGSLIGMRRSEIRSCFDQIVAFAEIERFLDTPVKHYSSGMYMRLAFAVAAHLNTEILFIDEVLAVGDAQFQRKCLGKMSSLVRMGRTVVFVSHNLNAIATLCARVIWLDEGSVRAHGPAQDVISAYLRSGVTMNREAVFSDAAPRDALVAIVRGALDIPDTSPTNATPFAVRFCVDIRRPTECNFVFYVYREGSLAFLCADYDKPLLPGRFGPGRLHAVLHVPARLLNPGFHSFGLAVVDRGGNARELCRVDDALSCLIDDDMSRRGGTYLLGWDGAVSPPLQLTIESADGVVRSL
jgi:lipopolysaccharide transport system ATP-binding protein